MIPNNQFWFNNKGSSPAPSPILLLEPFGLNGFILPNNWYYDPVGWTNTSPDVNTVYDPVTLAGIPYCNIVGSSGGPAIFFTNSNGTQEYIRTSAISTLGKTNVKLTWNQWRENTVPPITLAWSSDNITWNPIAFTEVTDDDNWHATNAINLPVGVENLATLYIRFGQLEDVAGTFTCIDDVKVFVI